MRFLIFSCAALAAILLAAGCSTEQATDGAADPAVGPLAVAASLPPLAYLVERIGAEHVAVTMLMQPGQDPHVFEPTPRQVSAMGRVRLLVMVGMPFETRLAGKLQATHRALRVLDTAEGLPKRPMDGPPCDHDHHGQAHHHHDAGEDPHVWLAPQLLGLQAERVAAVLSELAPQHADTFRGNLETFLRDLETTNERIRARLEPYRGQTFYVYHPAFGYFADAYGLRQEAVEVGGKTPSPRQLADITARARAENVRMLFVQPQMDRRAAEIVADAIGGTVEPLDPLAKDVLENLEKMAEALETAMRG